MPAPVPSLRAQLQLTGIRRSGGPRNGYRYRCASGAAVPTKMRARLTALRIPPAWRLVAISPSATAKLQAVGVDAAGRWQYLYRADYSARRAGAKFDRVAAFARALPALRRHIRRDLALPGTPLPRVCAIALLLLLACPLRAGGRLYARDNGTFGLATLRPQHVSATADTVTLRFRGKHGVAQRHTLRSPRLARLVRLLLGSKRRELFHYTGRAGKACDLTNEQLNAYVRNAMGARFTAKDFRTCGATLLCAGLLRAHRAGNAEQAIARAVAATAAWLGNTPAVARAAYIHPRVLDAFREGITPTATLARPESLIERMPRTWHPAERALLRLLEPRPRRTA